MVTLQGVELQLRSHEYHNENDEWFHIWEIKVFWQESPDQEGLFFDTIRVKVPDAQPDEVYVNEIAAGIEGLLKEHDFGPSFQSTSRDTNLEANERFNAAVDLVRAKMLHEEQSKFFGIAYAASGDHLRNKKIAIAGLVAIILTMLLVGSTRR